jgi:hypothetical protein
MLEQHNPTKVRAILAQMVPEYQPSEGMVDYLANSPARRHLRVVNAPLASE